MHPWTRQLHKNAMGGARERRDVGLIPPSVPRLKRRLGWLSDHVLVAERERLKGQEADPDTKVSSKARKAVSEIEHELTCRKIEEALAKSTGAKEAPKT